MQLHWNNNFQFSNLVYIISFLFPHLMKISVFPFICRFVNCNVFYYSKILFLIKKWQEGFGTALFVFLFFFLLPKWSGDICVVSFIHYSASVRFWIQSTFSMFGINSIGNVRFHSIDFINSKAHENQFNGRRKFSLVVLTISWQ